MSFYRFLHTVCLVHNPTPRLIYLTRTVLSKDPVTIPVYTASEMEWERKVLSQGRNVSLRVSLPLIYVTFRVYARCEPSINAVSRAGRVLKTLFCFGFSKTLRKFFRRVLRAASPKTWRSMHLSPSLMIFVALVSE